MPRTGAVIRRSGKYNTVFKVLRSYRNHNGTPTSERVAIGKLDPETGMLIPNDKYWEFYAPDESRIEIKPRHVSTRSVGGAYLFNRIAGQLGLSDLLRESLGERRSALAMTAALYMVARGNVFENVLSYCEGYTLSEPPLTSQTASDLFSSISFDERMGFFRGWVAKRRLGPFLAYDVTSFSTYAKTIHMGERGYDRDGDKLPQVNFGCYLSKRSGLPIFYVQYPGSIVDRSHLPYMMAYNKDLGIEDVGFIMDRDFCSTANVQYMSKEKLAFILGVDKSRKATRGAIDSVRDGLAIMSNKVESGVFAKPARGNFYGAAGTMHVYYSLQLAREHMDDLERTIQSEEETLAQLPELTKLEARRYRRHFVIDLASDHSFTYERDKEKIDALGLDFGFFCLLTNTKLSGREVLEEYRGREPIENAFDDLKNHVDMRRMRIHSKEAMDGKMFCAFIALIVVSEMGVKLEEFMRKKSWSKEHVIIEMEKIHIVPGVEGIRLSDPLTKTQRDIIESFGLDEDDLVSYIKGDIRQTC
jgi:hypothetical protein